VTDLRSPGLRWCPLANRVKTRAYEFLPRGLGYQRSDGANLSTGVLGRREHARSVGPSGALIYPPGVDNHCLRVVAAHSLSAVAPRARLTKPIPYDSSAGPCMTFATAFSSWPRLAQYSANEGNAAALVSAMGFHQHRSTRLGGRCITGRRRRAGAVHPAFGLHQLICRRPGASLGSPERHRAQQRRTRASQSLAQGAPYKQCAEAQE
jgi:hypothetical protein